MHAAGKNFNRLDEMEDCSITTPSNGQVIVYDTTSNTWENKDDDQSIVLPLHIYDTTQSSSVSTGALICDGGGAFAKNLIVGGSVSLGGLTDNVIYADGTGIFKEITPGTSMSWSAPTLNTVQDIQTTASPTFVGATLSGLTDNIVYADGTGVLTEITPGSNLSWSAPTLDTIQDIQTTSSPAFAGLSVTGSTDATSKDTGSLILTDGGFGSEKAIWSGTDLNAEGMIYANATNAKVLTGYTIGSAHFHLDTGLANATDKIGQIILTSTTAGQNNGNSILFRRDDAPAGTFASISHAGYDGVWRFKQSHSGNANNCLRIGSYKNNTFVYYPSVLALESSGVLVSNSPYNYFIGRNDDAADYPEQAPNIRLLGINGSVNLDGATITTLDDSTGKLEFCQFNTNETLLDRFQPIAAIETICKKEPTTATEAYSEMKIMATTGDYTSPIDAINIDGLNSLITFDSSLDLRFSKLTASSVPYLDASKDIQSLTLGSGLDLTAGVLDTTGTFGTQTVSTSLTLSYASADTLCYLDGSKIVQSASLGSNLGLAAGTLSISTTPTFNSITLSNMTASRLLCTDGSKITKSASVNATNLTFTSDTLNTIQDISTTSTPSFSAVTLSGLTASKLLYTDGSKVSASASVSTTNLTFTAGSLNTVQDIATFSDVTFNSITASGQPSVLTHDNDGTIIEWADDAGYEYELECPSEYQDLASEYTPASNTYTASNNGKRLVTCNAQIYDVGGGGTYPNAGTMTYALLRIYHNGTIVVETTMNQENIDGDDVFTANVSHIINMTTSQTCYAKVYIKANGAGSCAFQATTNNLSVYRLP